MKSRMWKELEEYAREFGYPIDRVQGEAGPLDRSREISKLEAFAIFSEAESLRRFEREHPLVSSPVIVSYDKEGVILERSYILAGKDRWDVEVHAGERTFLRRVTRRTRKP